MAATTPPVAELSAEADMQTIHTGSSTSDLVTSPSITDPEGASPDSSKKGRLGKLFSRKKKDKGASKELEDIAAPAVAVGAVGVEVGDDSVTEVRSRGWGAFVINLLFLLCFISMYCCFIKSWRYGSSLL